MITQGGTATLSVVATGSLLSYQWFGNGAAVAGGTQPTLSTTTGGQFFVRISNSVGAADSVTVTVTVTGSQPSHATGHHVAAGFDIGGARRVGDL